MNKRSEQELFLNYIRDIYLAYPSLEINDDTIYNELSHFYEENGILLDKRLELDSKNKKLVLRGKSNA